MRITLSLAFLAPPIVRAAVEGRLPYGSPLQPSASSPSCRNYPAAQRLVSKICDEALERDIPMADPDWVLNEDSDVEVALAFWSVPDMILVKLAIT